MPTRDKCGSKYFLNAQQVSRIVCHRNSEDGSKPPEFLICWRSLDAAYPPLSWHSLDELSSILPLLQTYSSHWRQNFQRKAEGHQHVNSLAGTKRKHDGIPAPQNGLSPDNSDPRPVVKHSEKKSGKRVAAQLEGYNALFQRREGQIAPIPDKYGRARRLDVRTLPTQQMISAAASLDLDKVDEAIQVRYAARLACLRPPVSFRNDFDRESPSLKFDFIDKYVLGRGVEKCDALLLGCQQCRPNMGANRGCEYTRKCDCLEFAEPALDKLSPAQKEEYDRQLARGEPPDTKDLPKRFPYYSTGAHAGTLIDFYLLDRHVIYECNRFCQCGPICKNRNVQHGRKVRLEVFKTPDRGFGLRTLETLTRGQFIDTYLGEIITDAEAKCREASSGPGKASYLFALDKFCGSSFDGGLTIKEEDCYVVDGEFMGGVSRFINHCCEPNVQMHTVSYNKFDYKVYDLAFFACDDIAAGEELVFDYMDADDAEANRQDPGAHLDGKIKTPCRCGAERCRGWLWT